MTVQNTTHILIDTLTLKPHQRPKMSVLASTPILDTLLPELSIWKTNTAKKAQVLENIDPYMLLETKQILKRVTAICTNVALENNLRFTIKLAFSGTAIKLLITDEFTAKSTLIKSLKQDKWLAAAFEWLCPNYTGLANSQEMVSFSYAYEKNRQKALQQYQHFKQPEQGMCCYLDCQIKQNEPKLAWVIASPKTTYRIEE